MSSSIYDYEVAQDGICELLLVVTKHSWLNLCKAEQFDPVMDEQVESAGSFQSF